ncbi:Glycogen phosphorylase [Bienertia sinuspersici]
MRCADRTDNIYISGVNTFPQFAFDNLESNSSVGDDDKKVPCPCNRCNNSRHKTMEEIYSYLLVNGIVQGYVRWIYHGEYKPPLKRSRNDLGEGCGDDIFRMIHDRFSPGVSNDGVDDISNKEQEPTQFDFPKYNKGSKKAKMFENLMRDAQQTLYPRFKGYVRNNSRPEGSIAEGYIIEECMVFCSMYLHDIETSYNQPKRNADEEYNDYEGQLIFASSGVPLGKAKCRSLTKKDLTQVREYVLKNCDEAQTYLKYDCTRIVFFLYLISY